MTLAHCISYAIYVRVLFIIKIFISFTIDILLKNTCPNPTICLFLNCSYLWSILSVGALIKLFLSKRLHVKTYRAPIFLHACMSDS